MTKENLTSVTNSGIAKSLNLEGVTIAGSVTNSGTLVANGPAKPSATGISVVDSTIHGALINSGTITAAKIGINVSGNAVITGGISNSGVIAGGAVGIRVTGVSNAG